MYVLHTIQNRENFAMAKLWSPGGCFLSRRDGREETPRKGPRPDAYRYRNCPRSQDEADHGDRRKTGYPRRIAGTLWPFQGQGGDGLDQPAEGPRRRQPDPG